MCPPRSFHRRVGVLLAATLALCASVSLLQADEVSVQINKAKVVHTTDPRFSGINMCPFWNNTVDSPPATKAYSQMNNRLFRFPGGVPAEWYDWSETVHMTPEAAWNMAKTSNAEMLFQTNAFGEFNKHGTGFFNTSGEHTADWAKWAKNKGVKVAFWEIGNEPEMDAPGKIKANADATYKYYNAKFAEQAKAIKAVDSTAKIMGPASTNTYFWWRLKNLEKFMLAQGNKEGTGLVDAVSIHWYPEDGGKGGWGKIRSVAQREWPKRMNYVRGVLKATDTRDLPLYITEWNFAAGDKENAANSIKLFNALGTADMIGAFRDSGVAGQTFFCYQHIHSNWGVLADTKEPNIPEYFASPTYYALAIANLLGPEVLAVENSADPADVLSAYAGRTNKKQVQLLLINKSNASQTVSLSISGTKLAGKKVGVYSLKGLDGKIDDSKVIYNGTHAPNPAAEKLPDPQIITLADKPKMQMDPYSLSLVIFENAD